MKNKEAIEILSKDLGKYILTEHDEAILTAINALEERLQGGWVRKEDAIHSITKQYSEHNELVPIWLSIGDIKGGAE